jgi:RNA polymerase sigma-70 factor (ECF subfamily)
MDPFEKARPRLFGLAYRMLGSRAEAEDIVQDTYLRWHQADRASIRTPEAWLVTAATRIAIDRLRALKTERDAYTGPWLPEPLMSEPPQSPDQALEMASDLSVAFLVMLERLAPEERAAFLLHDVFDRGYAEIAETLGKSESACRQIVHRARERVRSDKKRFQIAEAARIRMLKTFVAAVEARDEKTLLSLFAPDAAWIADGGGKAAAAPYPFLGAPRIVGLLMGLQKRFAREHVTLHLAVMNGETGVVIRHEGRIASAISFVFDGERIAEVYAVVNPDKLPPVTTPAAPPSSH